MTALHFAADRGCSDIADLLLQSGASVNALDGSGQTPLMYAVSCENKVSHHTAALLACQHNRLKHGIKRLCTTLKARNSPLLSTLLGVIPLPISSEQEVVEVLLRHGADSTIRNGDGQSVRDFEDVPQDILALL
jgi:ankyrin repeat protein